MTFNSLVEDQVNLHLSQGTDPFAPTSAQQPMGLLQMVPGKGRNVLMTLFT